VAGGLLAGFFFFFFFSGVDAESFVENPGAAAPLGERLLAI